MKTVSLRTLTTALVAAIVASGLLTIVAAGWLAERVGSGRDEWLSYRDASSPRAVALVDMGTHLGFGGVIHHLKNYVLRGDSIYVDRLQASAGGVRAAIERYRTAGPDAAEQHALAMVEEALTRIERAAVVAATMHARATPIGRIAAAVEFPIQPTLEALATLDAAVDSRSAREGGTPSKLKILYELRRSLGLGGMIQQFKEMIISGDPVHGAAAEASIVTAQDALQRYRAQGVAPDEVQALAAIASALDRYDAGVEVALTMAASGEPPAAIDDRVRVRDGPALGALRVLDLAVAREAAGRAGEIDQTMAETVLLSGALMVVVLLIAAIVCGLVLWLIWHAIQRPLTRLAEDMLRVADGDTSIGAGGGDSRIAEVVALGDALETFRTHVDALSRYTSALQQFQRLSTDVGLTLDQRIRAILDFGLERFGLTLAVASRTRDGNWVVEQSAGTAGPPAPGSRFDLDLSYGRHVLEAGRAIGFHDVAGSPLAGEACHRTFGLNAYIGAPVMVEGAPYGVIGFGSPEARAQPFDEADLAFVGLIARWLGMERERELTLARLAEAKAEAEDAARAKSEFLANMSHEIRTPMNAVIGLSGLALKVELSERARDYVEKISRSAQTLLRIINDILDFSRIEAGRLPIEAIEFTLDDVLQDVATLIGDAQESKSVEIVFASDPAIPRTLVGDPLRIGQVLLNLVGNALKFTGSGEIVVRIDALDRQDGHMRLRVTVTDTGIGMTEEQVARLFRAFSQADGSTTRRFGGTGLGLAISRQLVELMGGEITVQSRLGEGSTFAFTLTVGVPPGDRRHELPYPIDPSAVRILVVEDNAVARAVLHDTLSGLRFTDVEAVADGDEATASFRAAQQRGRPFDVVLMDWRLPGMDGIATAGRLRESAGPGRAPAIIMLTVHARAEVVEKAREAGISRVLFKPVNVSSLVDGIAEALNQGSASRAANQRVPEAEATWPRLRGVRVLLVEDNEINQQIAREILEGAGVTVEVADSGTAALTRLRAAAPRPDAVLMDLQMPELDGYETARWMVADDRFKDIPVIAMTAHVTEDERRRCLAAGMVDHVPKPIEVRRLLDALDHWIGGDEVRPAPVLREDAAAGGDALDLEAARARLDLPMEILQTAVDRFAELYPQAPETLAGLLESGASKEAERLVHTIVGLAATIGAAPKEAERLVHTIVGLAATIGAAPLSAAARAIEDTLRRGEAPTDAELQAFRRAHEAVFVAIAERAAGKAEPS